MATLLFDADDTQWENNIYFERALADFISFLEHKELSAAEVRIIIDDVERENIRLHGYGLKSFTKALVAAFEKLSVEPITEAIHTTITGFAQRIAEEPIRLIDGVPATLASLCERHALYIVTKGDPDEQHRKVTSSGIGHYFRAVEVMPEKTAAAYRFLLESRDLSGDDIWMIGNSPKSDVNPALEAGLNSAFIPHQTTWVLEEQEINRPRPTQRLLELRKFEDLLLHF